MIAFTSQSAKLRFFRYSLKNTVLMIFIPIVIGFILVSSFLSYRIASRQLEENTMNNVSDTVSQTKNYLDSRLMDIFEQFVALENNSAALSAIKSLKDTGSVTPDHYIRIQEAMDRVYATYNSILDSIVLDFNNGQFQMVRKNYPSSKMLPVYDYFQAQIRSPASSSYHWLNLHDNTVFNDIYQDRKVVSLFKLIGTPEAGVSGAVVFNLKESFFRQVLTVPQISDNGYLTLIGPDGYMQFKEVGSAYTVNDEVLDYVHGLNRDEGMFYFRKPDGKKMAVVYETLRLNGWKLAAVIPQNEILSRINTIKLITVGMILVIVALAVVVSHLLVNWITKPILQLTQKVRRVEMGDLNIAFDVSPKNEISILNNGIRNLILTVKELLTQVKEEERGKRNAQLAVLQSQVKPHFLYNTLESVRHLFILNEKEKADEMIVALSTYYRKSLSKGEDVVTVKEEVEIIDNYLKIMSLRYHTNLAYAIDVGDEMKECPMLKLLLQPVVENAIYHGIKMKRGQSLLTIRGRRSEGRLVFEVADRGAGMDPATLEKIRGNIDLDKPRDVGLGFGLRNVAERIHYFYKSDWRIDIESLPGEGTTIRIAFPERPLTGGDAHA